MKARRLLLLLGTFSACSGETTGRLVESGEAICSDLADASLTLSPAGNRKIEAPVPQAIFTLSPDSILTVDGKSSVLTIYSRSPEPAQLATPEPIQAFARAGSDVLAVGVGTIYKLRNELGVFEPVAVIPSTSELIVSLAGDVHTLWVGVVDPGSGEAAILSRSRSAAGGWSRRSVDHPVRLTPISRGRVAAASVPHPHTLAFFDEHLNRFSTRRSLEDRFTRRPAESFVTQAMVPLGCDRFVHVLADMRSPVRAVHLYASDGDRPRLLRRAKLERPLGFVQALPDDSLVLAVTAGSGWWEALWLKSSWTIQARGR